MKNFSLVSGDSVRNSQLNSSTAKHSFVFSKEQRFKNPPANCPVAFYQFPDHLSKRKTSLGYGEKSDFTRSSVLSPASNAYSIESGFKKSENRGITFGISRDKSPENGIIVKDALKVPGPGKYECKKNTLSPIAYTCRPRTIDFVEKKISYKQNPGPGAYEYMNAFPEDGRSFVSKFSNSKFAMINHSPRFTLPIKDSPAPNSYNTGNHFSRQGKYMLSHHRGDGTRAFSQTARVGFTDIISKNSFAPGPGLYEKPTDFGVYGDAKYYKTLSSFGSRHNESIG